MEADNMLTLRVTVPSGAIGQKQPVTAAVMLQKDRFMKFKLPLFLLAGAGVLATSVAVAAQSAPASAQGQAYWSETRWDDDADYRNQRRAMPVPNVEALKRAGMVRVTEVERDDGRLEVEGYDASGRELDIEMDAKGQRVLGIDRDDRDDRWDD